MYVNVIIVYNTIQLQYFKSNTFQNVQVRVVAMSGAPCMDDCSDNGVEMKIRTGGNDQYRRTGYRVCCANQLNTVFTSETPQVPVIATTLGNTVSFTLQYRIFKQSRHHDHDGDSDNLYGNYGQESADYNPSASFEYVM